LTKIRPISQVPQIQDIGSSGDGMGLIDAALTQNTWYTVLDTKKNVRIWQIVFNQDTAQETIEVKITDDVGSETKAQVAAAGTDYHIKLSSLGTSSERYRISSGEVALYRAFLVESRSFKVEIRKTTAAGANNTNCKVTWSQY